MPRLPPATSAVGKNTEIIKSRSGGSMAGHTNSAPATFRGVYLRPCSAPSANNDGHLEHTTAPVSLLGIIVSCCFFIFVLHNISSLKGALLLLFRSKFNKFIFLGYFNKLRLSGQKWDKLVFLSLNRPPTSPTSSTRGSSHSLSNGQLLTASC